MPESAVVKYEKPLNKPVQNVSDARSLILAHQDDLAQHVATAAGVTIEQVMSTAVSAIATAESRVQVALLQCTGTSILKAVADAARYGLVFGGVMGQAYLVPFKSTCQLIVGYRGLEALVYRSGVVKAMQSGVVYEGDGYEVLIGRQPDPIRHTPALGASHKPEKLVAAYAIAYLPGGHCIAESMTREDLDAIRRGSKSDGVYRAHLGEMYRKAPIRRLCKHLPLSPHDRAMLDEILSAEDAATGARVVPGEAVAEGERRAGALAEALSGETAAEAEVVDGPVADWDGGGDDSKDTL